MASPVLSRSPSTTFAPGPHRRSHPNLQNLHHLSLAPLTPKYPIDPSDYDAYYDPGTSELHSSTSLSQLATLPSPGGILTNSPARSRNASRSASRVRKKIKSHVHIAIPDDAHGPGDETRTQKHEAQGLHELHPKTAGRGVKSMSQSHLHKLQLHTDPSWLVQTGLSLTESSREVKGQSWISKRDSSTSLANTPVEGPGYLDARRSREGRTPRSGRATPANRSRVGSRNVSRNASRSRLAVAGLKMTSSAPAAAHEHFTPGASFATAPEIDDRIHEELDEEEDVEPNWSDAKTQAEMAAHLQAELEDEFEEDDGDPYGMLDFEGQGGDDTEDDEEEVKKAMRSWGVGGWGRNWMDGAIDALLMVEEGNTSNESEIEGRRESLEGASVIALADAEMPEQHAGGGWPDLYWFGRLIKRNANQ